MRRSLALGAAFVAVAALLVASCELVADIEDRESAGAGGSSTTSSSGGAGGSTSTSTFDGGVGGGDCNDCSEWFTLCLSDPLCPASISPVDDLIGCACFLNCDSECDTYCAAPNQPCALPGVDGADGECKRCIEDNCPTPLAICNGS